MKNGRVLRVGLIGLSSKSREGVNPGFWAEAAHLPAILSSPRYTLTALCNSSVEAAQAAIAAHNFDPREVRAFGDPTALAADENVDLVVCSVNVEKHHTVIKPALLAGKMVICEWPLAANIEQMTELTDLAREKCVRTAVGLQGRFSDCVEAIKTMVWDQGKIGRLLSTSMVVHSVMLESSVPAGLEYFCRREAGGNVLTIRSIHALEMMTAALGSIETCQSMAAVQRKSMPVVDRDGGIVRENLPSDVPDHVSLQGKLSDGACFTYQLRTGRPFSGTPVFDWRVYGDRGEIRVTSDGMGVQMNDGVKVQFHRLGDEQVDEIDVSEFADKWKVLTDLEGISRNTARLYEAFADEAIYGESVVTFEKSMQWARLVEQVYQSLD